MAENLPNNKKNEDNDSSDEDVETIVKKDIIFTVDDDIYEKCGVRRPQKGLSLDGPEAEKIYRYQIVQDIEKIKQYTGHFKDKVKEYDAKRESDAIYRILNEVKKVGMLGRYSEVANVTRELSWRNTSLLINEIYGKHLQQPPVIAQKRYKEWLAGKPQGPSKEYLLDKAQRKADNELWDNIKYLRFEKTVVELRQESKERARLRNLERAKEAEELKQSLKKKDPNKQKEEEEARQNAYVKTKRQNIEKNAFDKNRMVPSVKEALASMKNWDYGQNKKWDYEENSFGKYVAVVTTTNGARLSDGLLNDVDVGKYEGPATNVDTFIKLTDEIAAEFSNYIVETNLKKAEYFLSVQKKKAKKQAKIDAKNKAAEAAAKRRAALQDAEQARLEALMARTAVFLQGANAVAKNRQENEDEDGDADNELSMFEGVSESTVDPASANGVDGVPGNATAYSSASKIKEVVPSFSKRMKTITLKVAKKMSRTTRRTYALARYVLNRENWPKIRRRIKRFCCKPKIIKARTVSPEESVESSSVFAEGSDFQEVEALSVKKLREWEKYTEEEIDQMESSERKRLRKMRKKDMKEDEIKEQEERKAKVEAKIKEAKEQQELLRRQKASCSDRIFGKLKTYFLGAEATTSLSAIEQRKRDSELATKKLMQEEAAGTRAIETLIAFRERQRQAQEFYGKVRQFFTGIESRSGSSEEYNVDELIRCSRLGHYMEVIDIVDHVLTPISPNATNADGESAFYTVLQMIMRNEAAEQEMEVRTCWQSITAKFGNSVKAGKLDLVMKILHYKGGDVNFLKQDRDADGTAILHEAATCGANDLIAWLYRQKAKFDIRTSQLLRTPLMHAAKANQLETVVYLLKKGSMPTINAADAHGWTALHFAAAFAHPDLASTLLICGADAYARTKRGTQATDEAATRGRSTMVETIRTFKQPDLLHRRLLNFFEIKYMNKAKEHVPDAVNEDDDEEDGAEAVGEADGNVAGVEEQKADS